MINDEQEARRVAEEERREKKRRDKREILSCKRDEGRKKIDRQIESKRSRERERQKWRQRKGGKNEREKERGALKSDGTQNHAQDRILDAVEATNFHGHIQCLMDLKSIFKICQCLQRITSGHQIFLIV